MGFGSTDTQIKNEEKRIITEPNMKVEITKTTGRYAKSEVTVSYSGNISHFDPVLWKEVIMDVKLDIIDAVNDILKRL